jgi:hypothetical protein
VAKKNGIFEKKVFKKSKFEFFCQAIEKPKNFRNHKIGDRPVTVYLGDRWGFACAGSVVQASHSSHTESLRSERERRNERMKAQQAAAESVFVSAANLLLLSCRNSLGSRYVFGKRL